MIKLEQIKISVKIKNQEDQIQKVCAKKLKISVANILSCKILKRSVDARDKNNLRWVYSVGLRLDKNFESKFADKKIVLDETLFKFEKQTCNLPPVIVGFGPAGMFCALCFARMGLRPIVVEQGKCVQERQKDVDKFWQTGQLDEYSNVHFGEGGAGTFSDGKLNTNLNNSICKKILYEFCHFGADQSILIDSKPHIGSDKLKTVVQNIRQEIISLGGKILFEHKFVDFTTIENQNSRKKIDSVIVRDLKNDRLKTFATEHLVLALGHSARDSFKLLQKKQVELKQKPFAMGVRIEQKQSQINLAQYGADCKYLPNADYKLVEHLPNGRSIFTFCMCPGGYVVASSSQKDTIVTNGMSNFARDNTNANSAVLINVTPQDFGSDDALAGMYFQQKYERLAFEIGGKNYCAPCQTVGSFLNADTNFSGTTDFYNTTDSQKLNDLKNNKALDTNEQVVATYRPNVRFCDISKCLPDFVSQSLKIGLPLLDKKLKGFADAQNLLIAIESRTSSPITIVRDQNFESTIAGLYPIGEGAGYAGGIISSAQDGIKTAIAIYKTLK